MQLTCLQFFFFVKDLKVPETLELLLGRVTLPRYGIADKPSNESNKSLSGVQ